MLVSGNIFATEKKFIIERNITYIPDSAIVSLHQLQGMEYVPIVTTFVVNGKFHLEGKTDTITEYLLGVKEQYNMENINDTNT